MEHEWMGSQNCRKDTRFTKESSVWQNHTQDCFIYILDSSNSSSIIFWTSKFSSSSESNRTSIWTGNSNGSWTDKQSSHFSTSKKDEFKSYILFHVKTTTNRFWNDAEMLLKPSQKDFLYFCFPIWSCIMFFYMVNLSVAKSWFSCRHKMKPYKVTKWFECCMLFSHNTVQCTDRPHPCPRKGNCFKFTTAC